MSSIVSGIVSGVVRRGELLAVHNDFREIGNETVYTNADREFMSREKRGGQQQIAVLC
jgi:hypothetical protein